MLEASNMEAQLIPCIYQQDRGGSLLSTMAGKDPTHVI